MRACPHLLFLNGLVNINPTSLSFLWSSIKTVINAEHNYSKVTLICNGVPVTNLDRRFCGRSLLFAVANAGPFTLPMQTCRTDIERRAQCPGYVVNCSYLLLCHRWYKTKGCRGFSLSRVWVWHRWPTLILSSVCRRLFRESRLFVSINHALSSPHLFQLHSDTTAMSCLSCAEIPRNHPGCLRACGNCNRQWPSPAFAVTYNTVHCARCRSLGLHFWDLCWRTHRSTEFNHHRRPWRMHGRHTSLDSRYHIRHWSTLHIPIQLLRRQSSRARIYSAMGDGKIREGLISLPLDVDFTLLDDIRHFLQDKFDETRLTHPVRSQLPSSWPLSEDIKTFVYKSSGQFIYASTVIKFVSSPQHGPDHRLEIVVDLRPKGKDLAPLLLYLSQRHFRRDFAFLGIKFFEEERLVLPCVATALKNKFHLWTQKYRWLSILFYSSLTSLYRWTYPPFPRTIDEEWIYGRGSGDCKNNLIGILTAVEHLIDVGC